jgi:hypothetical protein
LAPGQHLAGFGYAEEVNNLQRKPGLQPFAAHEEAFCKGIGRSPGTKHPVCGRAVAVGNATEVLLGLEDVDAIEDEVEAEVELDCDAEELLIFRIRAPQRLII